MSRATQSSIVFGNEPSVNRQSSYAASNTGAIVDNSNSYDNNAAASALRHRKSDIFNLHAPEYSGQAPNAGNGGMVWDRNASTVFGSATDMNNGKGGQPYYSSRAVRQPPTDIFFSQPLPHSSESVSYNKRGAAPSAEPYHYSSAGMAAPYGTSAYQPSETSAPKRQTSAPRDNAPSTTTLEMNDYQEALRAAAAPRQQHEEEYFEQNLHVAPLSNLSQFEDRALQGSAASMNSNSNYTATAPSRPVNRHFSDIFNDQYGETAYNKGARRHYSQSRGSSDIFNTGSATNSAADLSAGQRRSSTLPSPQWSAGSSFSNVFGGSVTNVDDQSPRDSRGRSRASEPAFLNNRPSGLSSTDLNRDRQGTRGRPTYERAQDQHKSQIWF